MNKECRISKYKNFIIRYSLFDIQINENILTILHSPPLRRGGGFLLTI
ncbi:MAG: hypothetical protein M0P61_07320 [Ignavibacteriaceae bacterium]|nr:hypothetical protein [Ignavibacteriaceae bacterium]